MPDLIPWPFPLPERFLEVLGYARAVSARFPVTDQLRAQIRHDFGDDGLAAFEASLANRGPRRFVALFWEPAGDELGWTDGQSSGAGQLDHWLWLDYLHRRGQFAGPIHGWLVEHQVDLELQRRPGQACAARRRRLGSGVGRADRARPPHRPRSIARPGATAVTTANGIVHGANQRRVHLIGQQDRPFLYLRA
jgi:hypothetical protein